MVQRRWWCLRGWVVLVVVSMLLASAAFGAWARARDWEGEGDSDGKGRISNARADMFGVTVEGEMEAGSLWLGCTFTVGGTEYDQPVKNVKAGLLGRDKKFQVKFNAPSVIDRIPEGGSYDYALALWRYRVPREKCHKGEGRKPCEYCERNGYHMEDRVDTHSGSWSVS